MKFDQLKNKAKKAVAYTGIVISTLIPNAVEAENNATVHEPIKTIKGLKTGNLDDSKTYYNITKEDSYKKTDNEEEGVDDSFTKIDGDPDGGKGPEEMFSELNIQKFYKTGTVEFVDEKAEEEAMQSIRNFLEGVNFDIFKVKVVGTYSVERPYDGNDDLSVQRKDKGFKLVMRILSEKYNKEQIKNIFIETLAEGRSIYDNYSQEELNNLTKEQIELLIDVCQGTQISVEKIINNFEEKSDFSNVIAILRDMSGSMTDDMTEVLETIETIKKNGKKIEIVDILGGDVELHLKTLEKFLSSSETFTTNKEVLLLTDEPDNFLVGFSYNEAIARILALSIQKNVTIKIKIFNPNKEVGGFKVVTLNKNNKNILSSPTVRPLAYYSDNAPGKIKLIQAWFNGIKEKLYGNQDTDGDISSRN